MDVVVWNEFSGDWEQLNKEFEESFQYQSNDENSNIEQNHLRFQRKESVCKNISTRQSGLFRSVFWQHTIINVVLLD